LYKRNKIEIKYYQPGFLITRFLTSLSGEAPANTTNTREEIGGKTTTDRGDYSNYLKFFFFFPSFQPCGIGLLTLSSTLSVFSLATFSGTHNDEGGKKRKRRRRREKN
jgi:hypothetical protein